jgi:hypothetical protein
MKISGPVESIVIKGRLFEVDAEAAVNISLSGMQNEVKRSGLGGKRLAKSFISGSIEGASLVIDHANQDLQYLKDLQSTSNFFDVTITLCDGTIYSGDMQITDHIKEDTKEGTAEVSFEGDLEAQ